MVSFAAAVPLLVFTILGGVIADHVDRRKMLIGTQLAMMGSAFALAGLAYFRIVTISHVMMLAFTTGLAASLAAPANQALVPELVPREDLTNAVGLNSAQFNMSRVLGPMIGGFGMAWFGVAGNFFLNGLSFVAVIWSLTKLHYPERRTVRDVQLWAKMGEGFSTVRHDPRMRVLVQIVCIGAVLALPYFSFVPFFARDVLGAGERGLGILMAFSGLGAFMAAVTIAYLHTPRRRGTLITVAGTVFFAAVAGFSFSRQFFLSAMLQFVAGYAVIIMVAIINTRLQLLASNELRGRVMSIYATAYLGLPPLGSLFAGSLSKFMTPEHAIAAMALSGLLLFWLTLLMNPELRNLD